MLNILSLLESVSIILNPNIMFTCEKVDTLMLEVHCAATEVISFLPAITVNESTQEIISHKILLYSIFGLTFERINAGDTIIK